MVQRENASITVRLDIPSLKVMSATELVLEQYKPIVEEALNEVVDEFNTNSLIKQEVKNTLKKDIKHIIEDALKQKVKRIIDEQFYKNFDKITDKVRETINQEFENDQETNKQMSAL